MARFAAVSPRRGSSVAEAAQPLLVAHAEHRAQDHLERDPLHRRAQPERRARRPALDLRRRDLVDQLGVAAHALAVERRQQQLALAHVLVAVEGEQRVGAQHRSERAGGRLAAAEVLRVARERLLHHRRIGHVGDEAEAGEPPGEHVAVAAPAPQHPPVRLGGHHRHLGDGGKRRSGCERHEEFVAQSSPASPTRDRRNRHGQRHAVRARPGDNRVGRPGAARVPRAGRARGRGAADRRPLRSAASSPTGSCARSGARRARSTTRPRARVRGARRRAGAPLRAGHRLRAGRAPAAGRLPRVPPACSARTRRRTTATSTSTARTPAAAPRSTRA